MEDQITICEREEAYDKLTEQAGAFPQLQRGRPSVIVRACANESLQPRAAGAARPPLLVSGARAAPHALAPGARKTAQPHARNQNEPEVLEDQITICQ